MKYEKLFYIGISSFLILVLIFISFILSPLSSKNSTASLEKKIYYVDNISAAHKKVIDNFNEKYKGQIKVETINLPFEKFSTNERKELLARYLRSKSERIDVFSVDQIWVPRFAKWVVPFTKTITDDEQKSLLNFATESCIYKDTLVAIPLYIDLSVMFYNKQLLKTLPDFNSVEKKLNRSITWDEMLNLNERLKKDGRPFYLFQADDFEGLICAYCELEANQNTSIVKNDSLNVNTPEARKSLQLLVDLVNKYKASPKEVLKFKENDSYHYFMENKGFFLRGWSSFLNLHKTFYGDVKTYNELGIAPTPHFKGTEPKSVFGGWNLMISKFSKNYPEALKFVKYLISEEAQKILYEEGGFLPINTKIYEDTQYVNKFPKLKFYEKLLKQGFHRPFLEDYTNISDILSFYLHLAIKNEISVNEALLKASEKEHSQSILIK